jgi:hypothetical protein
MAPSVPLPVLLLLLLFAAATSTAVQRPCCECAGEPLVDKETNRTVGVFHWCPWGAGRYRGCHMPPRDPSAPSPAYSCNGSLAGGGVVIDKAHCPSPCLPPRKPPAGPRPPTPPLPPASTNPKRGVCLAPKGNHTHCDDLRALSGAATWYTNWGEADTLWSHVGCPHRPVVQGVEYVPQLWGKGHLVKAGALNTTLFSESKYLMAFNEPDQFSQSCVPRADRQNAPAFSISCERVRCSTNLSATCMWCCGCSVEVPAWCFLLLRNVKPEEAAALWPNMTALAKRWGLQLIAPCVSNAHGAKWWLDGACHRRKHPALPFFLPPLH